MRAEFLRRGGSGDGSDEVVGSATWIGARARLSPASADAEAVLRRIFRPAPVVVDDAALRPSGTSGVVVLQPGSLRWFIAAARSRATAEGLSARFVGDVDSTALPWDPAGAYRTFAASAERLVAKRPAPVPAQTGERREHGERGPSLPGTEAARPGPAATA